MKNTMKKWIAVLLVLTMIFALAACSGGSKDMVAGTWSGDLGADGTVTWTFDGKGGCTMENEFMNQTGTYTLENDQLTVKLENWDDPNVYTVTVDGNTLTMNDNEGIAVSGAYTKK